MYHRFQMRRALSIFLTIFLWLEPLAVTLPASDDARLPPCCRRHGAHHCAMRMLMARLMNQASSGKPIFTAPLTCPFYPGYVAVTVATIHALAPSPVRLPVLLAQLHQPAAGRVTARLSPIRTRSARGPPPTTPA